MNQKIQEVETFQSDHFVFSLNYDTKEIGNLLTEARILYAGIADIPIVPQYAVNFNEDLLVSSVHGTDAIEGNPMSEEEVKDLILHEKSKKQNINWELRIKNISTLYKLIMSMFSPESYSLDENNIRLLHKLITKGTNEPDNIAGKYRDHYVEVGDEKDGSKDRPPKNLADIKTLMAYFIKWINSDLVMKEDAFLRAGLAHYYLAKIHPFGNANGIVSRAIEASLLKVAGFKHVYIILPKYYKRHIDDYCRAFTLVRKSKEHDITPFLKFYLNTLIVALRDLKEKTSYFVRILSIENYVLFLKNEKNKINARQLDLMLLLLNVAPLIEFSINNLFTNIQLKNIFKAKTEMTVRRDIKGLERFQLIKKNKNNKYELNLKALG